MFQTAHPGLKDRIKYSFYYKYFKENFILSFGRPQVDVCSQFESFKAKLRNSDLCDNGKRSVIAEQMVHKRRAKIFCLKQKEISQNKDKDTILICIDFMQNLPLPHLSVQEVFYMRQLWLNLFCIQEMKTNSANMYMYHKREANKSADEVCSMLLHYLQTVVFPNGVKHIVLFSNGQNKNHCVVFNDLCDKELVETVTIFLSEDTRSYLATVILGC